MTAKVTQLYVETKGNAGKDYRVSRFALDPAAQAIKQYRVSQFYIETIGAEAVRAFFLFPNIEWIKEDQLKQAYVVFTAYETLSEDLYLRLAFANTSTPTAPASADELRSIETTSAAAYWTPGAWTEGNEYSTGHASLVAPMQEIVNRDDWEYGNSIMLIVDDAGADCLGHRRACSTEYQNSVSAAYLCYR